MEKLDELKAALTALQQRETALREALHWLQDGFRLNLGGGEFHCPWCYKHPPDDGHEYHWEDIKHTDDCLIGKALSPTPTPPC
jgi:hypothetical protein